MFDGLFSLLKNVFVFAIIIIAIAFVLFVVWLVYDSKKTAEHNRKVAEKKRKDEDFLQDARNTIWRACLRFMPTALQMI